MAATSLAKRVGASIVFITEFLVMGAGLILHVPEAIQRLLEDAPTWTTAPNTWWIAANGLVTAIVLYCIWRIPSDDESWATEVSLTCSRLVSLSRELLSFRKMLSEDYGNPINKKLILEELEILLPPRIKMILGDRVHDEFIAHVANAKKRSKTNPYLVYDLSLTYLDHEIWNAVYAEIDKLNQAQKESPAIES